MGHGTTTSILHDLICSTQTEANLTKKPFYVCWV